jgi:hypothetical protein
MRCKSTTKNGRRCKAMARKGFETCLFHGHTNKFTGSPMKNTRRNVRKYNRKK